MNLITAKRKRTITQICIVVITLDGRNGNRYFALAPRPVKSEIIARIREISAHKIPLWPLSVPSSEPPPKMNVQKLVVLLGLSVGSGDGVGVISGVADGSGVAVGSGVALGAGAGVGVVAVSGVERSGSLVSK